MAAQSRSQGEHLARVHTTVSNRRNAREAIERKTTFKYVLENPFHIQWPKVSPNVQNAILGRFIELAKDVAEYNVSRRTLNGKTKTARKAKRKSESISQSNKKRKLDGQTGVQETSTSQALPSVEGGDVPDPSMEVASIPASGSDIQNASNLVGEDTSVTEKDGISVLSPPPIISNITIGINAVTKRLEAQSRPPRLILSASAPSANITDGPGCKSKVQIVLICQADIESPLIIAHFPHLIAACNSYQPAQPIKLVPFPKDSERCLAETIGLRRVAVVALDEIIAKDPALSALMDSVPPLIAPWIISYSSPVTSKPKTPIDYQFIPTHIKQLRTTAPKDMKAAKELRAKGRSEAKLKKKEEAKKRAEEKEKLELEAEKAKKIKELESFEEAVATDPPMYGVFQPMSVYRGRN